MKAMFDRRAQTAALVAVLMGLMMAFAPSAFASTSSGTLHPCRNWKTGTLTTAQFRADVAKYPACAKAWANITGAPDGKFHPGDYVVLKSNIKLPVGTVIINTGYTSSGSIRSYSYKVQPNDRFAEIENTKTGAVKEAMQACLNETPKAPTAVAKTLPPMPTLVKWTVTVHVCSDNHVVIKNSPGAQVAICGTNVSGGKTSTKPVPQKIQVRTVKALRRWNGSTWVNVSNKEAITTCHELWLGQGSGARKLKSACWESNKVENWGVFPAKYGTNLYDCETNSPSPWVPAGDKCLQLKEVRAASKRALALFQVTYWNQVPQPVTPAASPTCTLHVSATGLAATATVTSSVTATTVNYNWGDGSAISASSTHTYAAAGAATVWAYVQTASGSTNCNAQVVLTAQPSAPTPTAVCYIGSMPQYTWPSSGYQAGQVGANNQCVPITQTNTCPVNETMDSNGNCVNQTNVAQQSCEAKGGSYDSVNQYCTVQQANGNCSIIFQFEGNDNWVQINQVGLCNSPSPPSPPPAPTVTLTLINPTHPQDGPGGVMPDGEPVTVCITAQDTKPGDNIALSYGADLGSFSSVSPFASTGNDTKCATYTAPNDAGDVGKTETWTFNAVDTTAGVAATPVTVSFTLQPLPGAGSNR